jgi:Zn-dependent metalloprotease
LAFVAATSQAAPPAHANNDKAFERLKTEKHGAQISVSSATGTASFVRIPPGQAAKRASMSVSDEAQGFISRHAQAFGLRVASNDLKLAKTEVDNLGRSHVKFTQVYGGVPVFGATIKAHFDANDQLAAVTGTLVPDIDVSIAPTRTAAEAGDTALEMVKFKNNGANLSVRGSQLLIFREGLAKGVPGDNHLAYEVEVGNGADVREFVYIDAHTGKYIDQISGITDALDRRAFDGDNQDFNYAVDIWLNNATFWVEGDAFPTGVVEADNMIAASEETYDLFANAFGFDSFDGAGATMDSIFNRGYSCPNASWNGAFISFCPGLTTDDVTGHEWAHAYTDYTDDLIYQWQPGALNESYSDIVGETVDRINGRDDITAPDARTDGSCSIVGGSPPPVLTITGGSAAGSYFSKASVNEPALPLSVGPLPMALANPADGCAALADDHSGQIVIIDWEDNGAPSACGSGTRAANAIAANAAGIIFVGPESGLLNLGSNSGIASVQVTYADGGTIKGGLPADATFAINLGTDDSVTWLLGEDSTAAGLSGALRDMWTPGCFGDPGKVSDEVYACDLDQADGGGVHTNSGIPNHAFSLLVDGGDFNGQSINSIGLTKANHIYFRAKTHYQGPATGFPGHADALEQSCADLVGTDVASLLDGSPSGEVISAADCAEVAKAMLAVEMRDEPVQCGFEPMLAKNPPPLCGNPTKSARVFFTDGFEDGKSSLARWRISHYAVTPEDFTERDWEIVSDLPDDRAGRGFFAPDPTYGTCAPGGDESAVLHLDSPQITIPASAKDLAMAFDHWVSTENFWDGANVKISVNGGEWEVVHPAAFIYNAYNVNSSGYNFLAPDFFGNTNPMQFEYAFSGTDQGSVDGSWGRSIIDLRYYAAPKDKIRLRFDMGNDGCGGAVGWYVDDVSVYECR